MCDVINLREWVRSRGDAVKAPGSAMPTRSDKPRGMVKLGVISAEIVRRLR